MSKEILTKKKAISLIREFIGGYRDTRKELFETYFSVSDIYELPTDSVQKYHEVTSEITNFLERISTYIKGVGMSDREWLKAEEKSYINKVSEILSRLDKAHKIDVNEESKVMILLGYSKGEAVDLSWLPEEDKDIIDYLPMPILEFTIMNYQRNKYIYNDLLYRF